MRHPPVTAALRAAIVLGDTAGFRRMLENVSFLGRGAGQEEMRLALSHGQISMAERLRRKGVGSGDPALWHAFLGGSAACGRGWAWMNRFGASLAGQGEGVTPLHLLARWHPQRVEWIQACLDAGGSWHAKGALGQTPWDTLGSEDRAHWR